MVHIKGFTYPSTRENVKTRISKARGHGYQNVEVTVRLIKFKGDFLRVRKFRRYLSDYDYILHTEYEDAAVPWGDDVIASAYIRRILEFTREVGKMPSAIILHPGHAFEGLLETVDELSKELESETTISVENRPKQCVKRYRDFKKLVKFNDKVQIDLDIFQLRTATKRDFLKELNNIASNLGERIRCIHIHWKHTIPHHPKNEIPWNEVFKILSKYNLSVWCIPEVTSVYKHVNEARKYICELVRTYDVF